MFVLIDGIHPIWWVALALAIGAVEMLAPTTLLLWPALSALLVAGLLVIEPTLSGGQQLAVFALAAIVLTVVWRLLAGRLAALRGTKTSLNDPIARMCGREAELIDSSGGEGTVLIDGVRWHAKWLGEGQWSVGQRVLVCGADGATLHVKNGPR